MASERIILGIGLAILFAIGAASVGLDLTSRSDIAAVDRASGILQKISDMRPMLRRADSAARGFAITGDREFAQEYRDASDALLPAFAALIEAVKDNPTEQRLIEAASVLVERQITRNGELIRFKIAGDDAAVAALVSQEDIATSEAIAGNLERAVSEERRLLGARRAQSETNSRILLAIDLAGVVLILIIATALVVSSRRSRQALQDSLTATMASKEALEAAVAERTAHLVAAHNELRLSAAVLRSTFHSMAEAVLVIDTKGEILLSNPAAEKMLNYRPGMTVKRIRSLNLHFQPDGVTPVSEHDMPSTRVLRGETFDASEMIARPVNGDPQMHLIVSGRPLRDASGAISGAALVYHDATASRETERKLLQSQKLDAIGKLTGGVAHDFNNMLTVITGTAETLVDDLATQPALQKTAKLINQAAERCSELIQHLLAFARRQPLQPRDVDVNATVLDIAKLLRPTLGEQIEINSILEQETVSAHIDASQLANSLLNMAINARDAMPNGGKLLLETRNVVLDESYAQANPEARPGPYVMLAVSDTGGGMSQDVLDKVFEPFFTTKDVGKGSGLGLSMVYGFVKQSGGHIRIYSEVGHGTTIKLYLPPARGRVEPASVPAAALPGGSENILVVEDDALVRNFVITQLQALGYRTVGAATGPEALRLIENGQKFELLFTDVIMPGGMSGRDLADKVRQQRPAIKVLYTSGYTDNAIEHQGRLDPGVLLLTKPYRMSQLATMVRRALTE
jgi:PAS domain S-box-containing protein